MKMETNKTSKDVARRAHKARKIDFNEKFTSLMQKPMLDKVPPLPKDPNQTEYLGVLCLRDTTENCRKYHMFCCKENSIGKSYLRVIAHYKHKPNIQIVNEVTTQSVSALSLFHSVRKHFWDHQWNAAGTVFSTDNKYTEWQLIETIHEIRDRELEKFVHYLLFLRKGKN